MREKTTREERRKLVSRVEKSSLTNSQKRIFRILLFTFYNVKDGRCFPRDTSIQKETRLSLRTINRAREALEAGGWIKVWKIAPNGRSRNYSFPMLEERVQRKIEDQKHLKNEGFAEARYQTKSPKKQDKKSSWHIEDKTTPLNHHHSTPAGRSPVFPGSPEEEGLDKFLCGEGLPRLSEIIPMSNCDKKPAYFVKHLAPRHPGTAEYSLAKGWYVQKAEEIQTKINQKEPPHA